MLLILSAAPAPAGSTACSCLVCDGYRFRVGDALRSTRQHSALDEYSYYSRLIVGVRVGILLVYYSQPSRFTLSTPTKSNVT